MLLSPFQETSEVATSAKPKTKRSTKVSVKAKVKDNKKWSVETDNVEFDMDQTMERILKRDGRAVYREASHELLRRFAATISYMDGRPKRLLGMLRRLEAMYAMLDEADRPAVAA